jgi:hypothetical protein
VFFMEEVSGFIQETWKDKAKLYNSCKRMEIAGNQVNTVIGFSLSLSWWTAKGFIHVDHLTWFGM